jgi:hypothetical protein
MAEKLKPPSKKRLPYQGTFIEMLIKGVVVRSISFGSINHPFFREMAQLVNSAFSAPAISYTKALYQAPGGYQLRITRGSRKGPLLIDGRPGEKKCGRCSPAVILFTEGYM